MKEALQAWLEARGAWGEGWTVSATRTAEAGHSNRTTIVTLDRSDGSTRRIVLRRPTAEPAHLDAPLDRQVAVQRALARAGVAVPWPAHHEEDRRWLGAEFLTMAFVEGHVVGEVPAADPWLAGTDASGRRRVHEAFGDALASVHLAEEAAAEVAGVVPGRAATLADDLERWQVYASWAAGGQVPSPLRRALDWCDVHRPATEPSRTLTWGDPRLGNAVFGEEREVRALLDWETAHLAPGEFDVAWWVALEAVQAAFLGPVDGFADAGTTWGRWERAVGRTAVAPEWFEALAVTAAACFTVRLHCLRRGAPPTDEELAAHPLVVWLADRMG